MNSINAAIWALERLEQTELAQGLIRENDAVIANARAIELEHFKGDMICEREGRRQQLEGREE
jgi:hypothetical protein